ncbi:MAG: hypothetical protein K2N87_02485 [Eubacterium sp.]|nr:hypothetical protein [Eubacterium sp.]
MQFLNLDKMKEKPEKYANGWCMTGGEKAGIIHAKYGFMDSENDRQEISWDDSLEEICKEASKNHFLDVYERKLAVRLLQPYITQDKSNLICDFGASSGYMVADLEEHFPWNQFVACDLCGGGYTDLIKTALALCIYR